MARRMFLTILLALSSFGFASAQEACPPPSWDLETLKERMLTLATRDQESDIASLLSIAVAPGTHPPACPLLTAEHDLGEALDELIRFAAAHTSGPLQRGIFGGVAEALRVHRSERAAPEIPLTAMALAMEQGNTPHGRGLALWHLLRLAEDGAVQAYLLRQARAPEGPPAWPDLPQAIVDQAYFSASERNAGLRAALEADLSLVRNPTARCLVNARGGRRHFAPSERGCR